MKYFEDNPEIFAALVAAIAIVGGLLGSVVGAKIQAKSGMDQAAAAREAAKIAAEAQRVAALWNVRQVQVAEFIRSVRETVRMSNHIFWAYDADSRQETDAAYQELNLRMAEIELIAPQGVVDAAAELTQAAHDCWDLARSRGPAESAKLVLARLVFSPDNQTAEAAMAAQLVLQPDVDMSYDERRRVLLDLPGLSEAHVVHLLRSSRRVEDPGTPPLQELRAEAAATLEAKMPVLVEAAREMLRSEDDVAPAVPRQRRRTWWRGGRSQ
ncbi:hypothetical protein [Streptomyces stackebrandtii]|uniref:hypothetical protein n=1 Tax=Streptomyces stackebrandtii TaxID=3051177 RepID=UPI0028DBB89E|nr:hypothetical protein [Streptomyces sp. DSM 40976]